MLKTIGGADATLRAVPEAQMSPAAFLSPGTDIKSAARAGGCLLSRYVGTMLHHQLLSLKSGFIWQQSVPRCPGEDPHLLLLQRAGGAGHQELRVSAWGI